MMEKRLALTKPKRRGLRGKKLLFYVCVVALPLLQFLIFYVGVNVNSFLLAFRSYDYQTGSYSFAGVSAFKKIFHDMRALPELTIALKNSFLVFFVTMVIGLTLALVFSYYIYKKFFGHALFRVLLFLPFILSNVTMVILYKYFVEDAAPAIIEFFTHKPVKGLLSNYDTKFNTILFFTIFTSFGIQTLIYSGSMSGISESIIESAQLDGITPFKEFWYICVPMIYPTVIVFITTGIASIFTNQMSIYSFYGQDPGDYSIYTIGYWLYQKINSPATTIADYPYLSAFGLILTLFTAPVTLLVRWGLQRLGGEGR